MVAGFLRSVLFSWRLRDAAADCFIREGLRAVFRHLQPNIRIYGGIWSCGHCRMDGGYGIVTGSVRLPEMPLWARVGFKQACYGPFWYAFPWKGFYGCMRLIRRHTGIACFLVMFGSSQTGCFSFPLPRPVLFPLRLSLFFGELFTAFPVFSRLYIFAWIFSVFFMLCIVRRLFCAECAKKKRNFLKFQEIWLIMIT